MTFMKASFRFSLIKFFELISLGFFGAFKKLMVVGGLT